MEIQAEEEQESENRNEGRADCIGRHVEVSLTWFDCSNERMDYREALLVFHGVCGSLLPIWLRP